MQWPKGKGKKDKQWSTKHYTENWWSSCTNYYKKNRGELMCSTSDTRRVYCWTTRTSSDMKIVLGHQYSSARIAETREVLNLM